MRARLVVTQWSFSRHHPCGDSPCSYLSRNIWPAIPPAPPASRPSCWAMADAVALAEIREEREFTRTDVARLLTSPANVSRIERQRDLYLSTLAQYVAALGGTLKVSVVFDDGEVEIGVSADARRRRR